MSTLAGSLEIQLFANVARLAKDMSEARGVVGSAMKDVERAVEGAKMAIEALGLAAFIEFVKRTNEATAAMKDLALESGTTAEKLSRFELPARAAGSSLEAVSA